MRRGEGRGVGFLRALLALEDREHNSSFCPSSRYSRKHISYSYSYGYLCLSQRAHLHSNGGKEGRP